MKDTINSKCKSCGSCGMPLVNPSDYALSDITQNYCVYCTDFQGNLKPYQAVLEGMADYIVHSQGIDHAVALTIATETLKSLPAWKNYTLVT